MGWGSLLGSIGSLIPGVGPISAIVGGVVDQFASDSASSQARSDQQEVNRQNIELAREQMSFQERMSSTSYQRAVKDMREAGLNPMLGYSQGGASSPGGAMTRVENPASAATSSALQAAQVNQALNGVQLGRAQIENVKAQTDQIRSQTYDVNLNSAIRAAELDEIRQRANSHYGNYELALERSSSERQMRKPRLGILGHEKELKGLEERMARDTFSARSARAKAESKLSEFDLAERELTFSDDVKRRIAEAQISQFGVPVARAAGKFAENFEDLPKAMQMIVNMLGGLSNVARTVRR